VALEQQTSCSSPDSKQLSELRTQIRQLIKFVALNYLAVVKAIKKRNRHCKVGVASSAYTLQPCIEGCTHSGLKTPTVLENSLDGSVEHYVGHQQPQDCPISSNQPHRQEADECWPTQQLAELVGAFKQCLLECCAFSAPKHASYGIS